MNGSGVWHAEHAWVGHLARGVLIEVEDGRIRAMSKDVAAPAGATLLKGLTVPGLANAHSHAFQRALRGRTQDGAGDFWEWRRLMYELAAKLDPDSMHALARDAYAEMVQAGITAVGEFHYVHHRPGGGRYDDPNAMGEAVIAAAKDVGIRITLLDACYLRGGIDGRSLEGAQLRFGDGDAAAWADRVALLRESDGVRIGVAIHSVRAVDPLSMRAVAAFARVQNRPLHLHLAEQLAEVDECENLLECTPVQLCNREEVLGPGTTAVHAIHVNPTDVRILCANRTRVCLCPTTERDLGDRVGPARELASSGCQLCLGSDSNAVIDLVEEARAAELDQRRATGRRGLHTARELIEAATVNGMNALGWEAGELVPGKLADFVTFGLESPDLNHLVFTASSSDVSNVVVGGRTIVSR